MKYFKYIILSVFALGILGCEEDDRITDLSTITAPTEISAQINIEQDNSGLVSITPTATSASIFEVFFGDTADNSIEIETGETVQNTYEEGVYDLRIVATGVTGLSAEETIPLTVSFQAPQNLEISITPVAGSNFDINVTATADLETNFEFYAGEFAEEEAISFLEGEVITYSYSSVGTYTARVVALSGGAETTEATQEVVIANPLLLPVDFEDTMQMYNFIDFEGTQTTVEANPSPDDTNSSAMVAQTIKTAGAAFFAGSIVTLDEPIDFSTLNNIKLDVLAPAAGITVKMKLENATDPNISAEVDVINTVANAWETLTYDFSGADLTQEYSKIIVFFDFGNDGDGSTYLWDNIDLTTAVASGFDNVEDFEGTAPMFIAFGDMQTPQVVANPNPSGENTTANVVEMVRTSGSADFAGAFFELNGRAIDFNGVNQVRLKSYSPTVGSIIKVKLENEDASITTEVDVATTVANQWETLTYSFTSAPEAQYTRIVVFYDFGNVGNGETYYYDEIEVGEGEIISTATDLTIEDFENGAPATFISFEGATDPVIVANPNPSAENNTAMAVQIEKTDGAQFFAGTFFEVNTPLDLNTYSKIRVKTLNPSTGLVVKLRLENQDNSTGFEVDVTNGIAGAWETLEYDFSGAPVADYVRIVIFFDFENGGMGTTHFFDEFELTN